MGEGNIAPVSARSWSYSESGSLEQFCDSEAKSLGESVNCRRLRIGATCFTFATRCASSFEQLHLILRNARRKASFS